MPVPEDAIMLEGEETTFIWETSHTDSFGGGGGGDGDGAGGGEGVGTGGGGGGGGDVSTVGVTTVAQPDGNGDVAGHEDGEDVDDNGNVLSRYHLDTVQHPDGSREFSRTDTFPDGSTSQASGASDGTGNSSYSELYTHTDGSSVLVTRTTDAAGHGTEHKTWLDAAGNETDDETTDF